jgi:hypothetical protein
MTLQEQLLDIHSLWRIPAALSKRSCPAEQSRDRLCKVIGLRRPGIIDLSPADFWHTLLSAPETASHTVVAIIGDFLRDKVEEKSLPWYLRCVCSPLMPARISFPC